MANAVRLYLAPACQTGPLESVKGILFCVIDGRPYLAKAS
jgi:hypothetical protein